MKLWVYLNSAFLLRAAIGFSRRLTLAGEASYSFSLYSIICCISCTYFHLMLVSGSFRKKPPHPRFFYYPVSSKNEGNLEPTCSILFPPTNNELGLGVGSGTTIGCRVIPIPFLARRLFYPRVRHATGSRKSTGVGMRVSRFAGLC